MRPPTYAGNTYLRGSDLWHGSRCSLSDLPCAGEDCRKCDVVKMRAAEIMQGAVRTLIERANGFEELNEANVAAITVDERELQSSSHPGSKLRGHI
jgi:hypothetical protein